MSKKLAELETALHSLAGQSPVPLARVLGKLGLAVGSNGNSRFGDVETRGRVLRRLEELPKAGKWLIYFVDASHLPPPVPGDDRGDRVWVGFRCKKPGGLW